MDGQGRVVPLKKPGAAEKRDTAAAGRESSIRHRPLPEDDTGK